MHTELNHPQLVPEENPLDKIATRLLGDSPWSSWESLDYHDADTLPAQETDEEIDWVQAAVLDSLDEVLKPSSTYRIKDIARSLGLPERTVEKAIDALDRRTGGNLRGTLKKGLELLETSLRDDDQRARIREKAASLISRFLK